MDGKPPDSETIRCDAGPRARELYICSSLKKSVPCVSFRMHGLSGVQWQGLPEGKKPPQNSPSPIPQMISMQHHCASRAHGDTLVSSLGKRGGRIEKHPTYNTVGDEELISCPSSHDPDGFGEVDGKLQDSETISKYPMPVGWENNTLGRPGIHKRHKICPDPSSLTSSCGERSRRWDSVG